MWLGISGGIGFVAINALPTLLWWQGGRGVLAPAFPWFTVVTLWLANAAAFGMLLWSIFALWRGSFPRRRRAVIGLALVVFVISAWWLELFCGRLLAHSRSRTYEWGIPQGYWVRDETFGFRPPATTACRSVRRGLTGNVVYDVIYETDAWRRRVTPRQSELPAQQFALFFGCSMTFGDGLPGSLTLPVEFEKARPEFRGYNYAFSGYGPQQALTWLRHPDFRAGIPETNGIAVYEFLDFHVQRAIGSLSLIRNWGMGYPYYYLDEAGKLVHGGSFGLGRPETSYLFYELGGLNTARLFSLEYPPMVREADIDLTAKILLECRNRFLEMYPRGTFIVEFFPGTTLGEPLKRRFAADPHPRPIEVIDLSQAPGFDRPEYRLHEEDSHPSALANRERARLLVEAVQARNLAGAGGLTE
jgi:hypothetical protein